MGPFRIGTRVYAILGNWWAFGILFVLSGMMFGYLVPRAQKAIFAHVTTDLRLRYWIAMS
jgi:hypothetical protein